MAAEAPPTPPGTPLSPSRPRNRDASSREADVLAASLAKAVGALRVADSPPRAPRQAPVLLILDVNGLLLDRQRSAPAPGGPAPDLVYSAPNNGLRSYVYDRPHAREFVDWAMARFRVAVWSSAQMHNLRPLVAHVFGAAAAQLAFVWAQEHCTRDGSVPSRAGGVKPRFTKDLRRVWDAGLGEPGATLLVDDDPYKAARNPPHTAIHPPAYAVAQRAQDDGLAPHAPLRRMLQRLADARGVAVPDFVAANPLAPDAAHAHAS
jgi:hypothetical protein